LCGHHGVTWIEAAGLGSIYTFSIARRGAGPFKEAAPYVVAYVELDEGVRMMTNVITDDVDSVHIGMRVKVRFEPAEGGDRIPRFVPA
jgi:uncharacterized OB-fold protein